MIKVCTVALLIVVNAGTAIAQGVTQFEATAAVPETQIDRLVMAKLGQLKIEAAHPCSDAVFVRRVYLDVTGTLPTAAEARSFLQDKSPDKRAALIDRLLERDEFADYWAMKWADVLRVKAEFPINLWPNAVHRYHRWIRISMKENKRYDQFVRELLTSSGSNFRNPPVNFYRAMQNHEPSGIASAVALTLMGTRTEHWPKEKLEGMAGFFTQVGFKATEEWKEEIIIFDPTKPAGKMVFPDGTVAKVDAEQDPREVFANWLIDAKNPWFAKSAVNRAWAWLVGRGIVHEADDFRPDNPPSNPELLAYLEKELVDAKWDMKQVYRLILNSRTYQLSSIPRSKDAQAAAQFAAYPVRRLEAEVLIDALNQITGTGEKYTSPIPEPFTFLPDDQRSIALADGSTTSSFLEMFGRPPRDTGLESERNNKPTPDQRLHVLNSSHIQKKIEQGRKMQGIFAASAGLRESATTLYLTILSRFPTEEELKTVETYSKNGVVKEREALIDLAWALINSAEFHYRH